jgi:DNA-binding winged helix-turn-helix (wHTH) protein
VQLLRTWISRLRGKLEKNPESPQLIRTIPKSGYITVNVKRKPTHCAGLKTTHLFKAKPEL